jgi:hypothetical protein
MGFWDKWTKKKVKQQCKKLHEQEKYIKKLEKNLKRKGK